MAAAGKFLAAAAARMQSMRRRATTRDDAILAAYRVNAEIRGHINAATDMAFVEATVDE